MPQERHSPSRRARRLAAAGLVGAVIAVAAALTLVGGDDDPAAAPHTAIAVELLDGGTTTLGDLKGRPAVVNFFASWCPPCVAEMPDFEAVHQQRSDEVSFLGLALQDSQSSAEALVELTGVSYPVAEDPDGTLYRLLDGIAMPTTVFLDAEGRVVDRHSGILSREQLDARIDDLVAGG